MQVALYVHIPFCVRRCGYCDFNTYAGLDSLQPAYGAGVVQEMRQLSARFPGLEGRTLYFGGGTPSLLTPELLEGMISGARTWGALRSDAEITLEVNPGTLEPARVLQWRAAGVNRISLGVQSVHDDELRWLGRIHTWAEAVAAVDAIRRAGFENLSLDLIFGLPGQTPERWEATLARTLALEPEHLSLYALTLDPETPLGEMVEAGRCPAPDDELAATLYEQASERLAAAGFWQYEISNWARGIRAPQEIWALPPGGESEGIGPWIGRHNLVYWRNEPWLGLGAGAHSWLGGRRWSNVLHPGAYLAALQDGTPLEIEGETIPPALEMGETLMLGLRLAEGMTAARFAVRFGQELEAVYGAPLARLQRLGLITWDGERVRLSARGRLLGNPVFAEFLP